MELQTESSRFLRAASCTHVGLKRKDNQDFISVNHAKKAYVLADGIGGNPHGDVAARIAAMACCKSLSRPFNEKSPKIAFDAARTDIMLARLANARLAGMGTTLVSLKFSGRSAWVSWVGDSRAYLMRDGSLRQITKDHSLGNGVLLRCINEHKDSAPETLKISTKSGDRFLLCSDGLSNMISHQIISSAVRSGTTKQSCEMLVNLAISAGGHDNISVIVVEVV